MYPSPAPSGDAVPLLSRVHSPIPPRRVSPLHREQPGDPGAQGQTCASSRLTLSPADRWRASEPRACGAAPPSPKPDAEIQ